MEGFLDTNGQTGNFDGIFLKSNRHFISVSIIHKFGGTVLVNANNVSPHEDFKDDELEKLGSKSLLTLTPIPPTSKAEMLEIGEVSDSRLLSLSVRQCDTSVKHFVCFSCLPLGSCWSMYSDSLTLTL